MNPVLVTGSRGMLGRAVLARLGERGVGAAHAECDVTRPADLRAALDRTRPAAVIHCAAWTDVDGAESYPEAAARLNADAVGQLAALCHADGIHLVTVSTDYVFTGEGSAPWPEQAPADAFGPLSVYGRTKLEGERLARAAAPGVCIARTQWLYGAHGKNFIDSIAALAAGRDQIRVVNDQVGAPSWVEHVADGLVTLADARAAGCYHVVNSGYASWYDVAARLVDRLGLRCTVTPCGSDEFPRPARRPHNSRLATDRFAGVAGRPLPPWQDALDDYLRATGRLA